jgi:hypothetical protein
MEQELKKALHTVAEEFDFSDKIEFSIKKSKMKKKWYVQQKFQLAFVFFLLVGTVFAISPEVRSMTEKWTTQVFQIDIFSKDDLEIRNGYVYIDGVKTISEEKYNLSLYTPVFTEKGYVLEKTKQNDFVVQKFTEENLGYSHKSANEVMESVGFKVMEPSFLPEGLTLDRFYIKDERVNISFQTENDKDLSIGVQERKIMDGFVVLDDVIKVDVGQNATLGKRPIKYWDNESNTPAVKAEYGITFLDNGIQYELFGTNLSKEELIKIAKSIK